MTSSTKPFDVLRAELTAKAQKARALCVDIAWETKQYEKNLEGENLSPDDVFEMDDLITMLEETLECFLAQE